MQRSNTEPFPAFVDELPEPFPIYDSQFADHLANQLEQIDPYDQPFLGRPSSSLPLSPVAKKLASNSRSPHLNQCHIFDCLPDFPPGIRAMIPLDGFSSFENGNTNCILPVDLMAQPTLPRLNSQLGLDNMQYAGGPYANFWETSKTYKARVNDHTVVGTEVRKGNGDENKAVEPRGKIKKKISRIVSALHREQPNATTEKAGEDVEHDPKIIHPDLFVTKAALDALRYPEPAAAHISVRKYSLPNPVLKAEPRIVNGDANMGRESSNRFHVRSHNRTFSIASITRTISKRLKGTQPDYRYQMLGLVEQPVPIPDCNCTLPQDRVSSINHWVSSLANAVPDDERQENFVALTTAELIGIGGADIDGIEIVKKYYAPQNSPVPEAAEPEEVEDIFEEDEERPRRKDLIEYLGTQRNSGFHLISMMNISGSTFDDPINLSDYYDIPLIEPEKAFQLNSSSNSSSISSSLSSTSTYAMLKDPRRYLPPAHSLILYLHGKGVDTFHIVQILGELDRAWLFEYQNRWYGNLRVPDLQEFTDEMVEKIRDACRKKREYWEMDGARNENGCIYPLSWKVVMWRQRQMDVRRLIERVVEKYLASKLRGKWKEVVMEV